MIYRDRSLKLLPNHWKWVKLGEVIHLKNGFAFKSDDYTSNGIPLIRISDINDNKVNTESAVKIPVDKANWDFLIESGDLLIAMSGATTGKTGIYLGKEPVLQNERVGNFKIIDENIINKKWRNLYVTFLRVEIENAAYGGAQPNISSKKIETFDFPLAPLNEQKRIADKLDSILARVDACRERLDRFPVILKRFRQSVLAAATSGKLTEEWRENSCNRSSWQEINVGELLIDIRYGTAKKCHYEPQATPVIRIPNICDGKISHIDLKYAEFDDEERQKLSLVTGDILMIRSNGSVDLVGRTALATEADEGFLYAGYLIRLRVNQQIVNPTYLSLALSAPDARHAIELTARSTSGVNNINTEEIKLIDIKLPNFTEQTEIVRRVEELFAYADRIEARYQAARTRVDKLTPAILAKAFRGELVPQDPSDEPASVLLERIRASRAEDAASLKPKRSLGKKIKATGKN